MGYTRREDLVEVAMLRRLDAGSWAAVEHAYGPATDVPDLLRALRSPDPAARQQARDALFGTIVHQGTRYAATAPAVPFLAELAVAPDIPDRHQLVELLTYAAIGSDQASLPAGIVEGSLDVLARTTNTPGDEQKYGPWALAAYQAVQATVPSFGEASRCRAPLRSYASSYAPTQALDLGNAHLLQGSMSVA